MPARERRLPERTCVGCRQRRAPAALVRCVLTADGTADVSRTAPGRGAWLCRPALSCFELAVRRRGFERAWRRPVGAAALAGLGRRLAAMDAAPRPVRRDDEKG